MFGTVGSVTLPARRVNGDQWEQTSFIAEAGAWNAECRAPGFTGMMAEPRAKESVGTQCRERRHGL